MRYFVTFFWAFVLGQVVGYLGSALTSGTYNFPQTTVLSLILGVIVILIGELAPGKKQPANHS